MFGVSSQHPLGISRSSWVCSQFASFLLHSCVLIIRSRSSSSNVATNVCIHVVVIQVVVIQVVAIQVVIQVVAVNQFVKAVIQVVAAMAATVIMGLAEATMVGATDGMVKLAAAQRMLRTQRGSQTQCYAVNAQNNLRSVG